MSDNERLKCPKCGDEYFTEYSYELTKIDGASLCLVNGNIEVNYDDAGFMENCGETRRDNISYVCACCKEDFAIVGANLVSESGCKTVNVSFSVSGTITQTIRITDNSLDENDIVDGLNSGKFCTTVQENGTVDVTCDGKIVGIVESVENNLEYFDFEEEI